MTEDRLVAATRALRAARSGGSDTADATEARVIALAQERRRPKRLHWLLPIAAVLAVSTSWAASRPDVRAAATSAWHRFVEQPPKRSASSARQQTTPSPARNVDAQVIASSSATAPFVILPTPSIEPLRAPVTVAPAPSRAISTPAAPALSDRVASPPAKTTAESGPTPLELYQQAHQLHFRSRDFAAALPAWDRYLAASSTGALALEARYNRAICLVQLGRQDEARAALLPFARGDYGGYRQSEAQRLIDVGLLTP
jgi:hypothetical protein